MTQPIPTVADIIETLPWKLQVAIRQNKTKNGYLRFAATDPANGPYSGDLCELWHDGREKTPTRGAR